MKTGTKSVRAMWKGIVLLGDEKVPVKLYAALGAERTDFRLLHAADAVPVKQEMVDPATGESVEREEVGRALEVSDGVYAVLSDEDLKSLEPEPSRDIHVLSFVPAGRLDGRWYDRPYWLGPDGDDEAYAGLTTALAASGREGIAQWVMRGRAYQGALRARDGHLMLVRLRHPEEVVPRAVVPAPPGREASDREIALARQLVEALEGEFDPEAFPDTYADRVRDLVAARKDGKQVAVPEAGDRPSPSDSLSDALERSVAAAGGRRG